MKPYVLGLLLFAPGLASAQLAQSYTIEGQVNPKINAPAKVYLSHGDGGLDSATVKNGFFILKGKLVTPSRASLTLSRQGTRKEDFMWADVKYGFYLEPGTTTFTSPDSLKYARVAGGLLTTDWQALKAARQPLAQQYQQFAAEYEAASPAQRKSLAFRQVRAERKAALHREANRVDSVFVAAHPASLVSADEIGLISNSKADSATARQLVALLAPTLRTNQGQQILNKLARQRNPAPAIGQPAPDFTLPDVAGQPVALSSYRGKYVLVDFWASWCGPCRAENPTVIRVYNAYKGRNFEVLGASIDVPEARAKWLKAVHDDHLPWVQVLDQNGPGRVAARYQVDAIPQNFLIDPSGKIVALNLRGEALKTTLAQFIK